MTNDELQSPETDAIAAAQVVNEEVEVVAAASDADGIVEEAAVPDELEAEEVIEVEADDEEEGE